MSKIYWRARRIYNMGLALSLAATFSLGRGWGLPVLFSGDHAAFVKGAELMLSVGSSLLGFVIAAVTLIYALTDSQKFNVLRASSSFFELAAACKAAMLWLLISSILGAIFLWLEPSVFASSPRGFIFVAVFVAAEVATSTSALTWMISRLIGLV
ncbi:hypothetical protein [Novosphingobium sp. THN1]|uniref:hypothetical protein n=1 Tax=Novosphingobium sp. THN1 TaxID=1016987 RepID=UPI0019683FC7|nr:hypothetical protein [Novosphingobium sp. THN1]